MLDLFFVTYIESIVKSRISSLTFFNSIQYAETSGGRKGRFGGSNPSRKLFGQLFLLWDEYLKTNFKSNIFFF